MTFPDDETLVREWVGALRKRWYLPFVAAAIAAGVAAYGAAKFNPLKYEAQVYLYSPPTEQDEFDRVLGSLPKSLVSNQDGWGYQLSLSSPTLAEARNGLGEAFKRILGAVDAKLNESSQGGSDEVLQWRAKARSQSVYVIEKGGVAESVSVAIPCAFMLMVAAILFVISWKYDQRQRAQPLPNESRRPGLSILSDAGL